MNVALAPPNRQEDMGVHQSARPARPERQTPDPVRREDAIGVQAGQGAYVHHEQDLGEAAL
jgi:hypothetical protein